MFALPKWVAYIAGPYLQAMLILSYIMSQNSNEVYNHSVNTRAICTCSEPCQHACTFCPLSFPAGSPSRGEDVTVYFSDINQPSLPTLFFLNSVLVSVYVFMVFSTVFHSMNSPDNSPLSHSVLLSLISALLILSTVYLFMTVSLSPDIILCGLTGLKAPTN